MTATQTPPSTEAGPDEPGEEGPGRSSRTINPMSDTNRPVVGLMDPLPPDPAGYCYWNRKHYDEVTRSVAHRLIRQHGPTLDRISPMIAVALFTLVVVLIFYLSTIGRWLFPFFNILSVVPFAWYATRERRLVRTILLRRMCFQCGYWLHETPTAEHGNGRYSECGRPFNVGLYRRPPLDYQRPQLASDTPHWIDSVHPLDRARMETEASQQDSETDP